MNISPISVNLGLHYKNRIQNNNLKSVHLQKPDSLSFTGYASSLEAMAKAKLNRESHVENYFSKIADAIWADKSIAKSPILFEMHDMYKKRGLRGILLEFWKAYPSKEFKDIVAKSEENQVLKLAVKDNESIVKLVNWGRHGFWNGIFNNQEAPRDIRVVFANKKNSVELYVDKKGDLAVEQLHDKYHIFTCFHALTGHKKMTAEYYSEGKPYYTYYNKDGSKSFWKNFFNGGTPVEPIY